MMDNKEVIRKIKDNLRRFVVTSIIDTGELYVATVCSHSGRFIPDAPYSMTYDGTFGRYNAMDPDNSEKLKNGTVIYKDYGIIEARKRLVAEGKIT